MKRLLSVRTLIVIGLAVALIPSGAVLVGHVTQVDPATVPTGLAAFPVQALPVPATSLRGVRPTGSFGDAADMVPASLTATVLGHRITDGCTGYHEVVAGTAYVIQATTTSASSGAIEFSVERQMPDGSWTLHETDVLPLEQGSASLPLRAGPSGRHRITVRLLEEPPHLAAAQTVLVSYVTPRWHRYDDGGVLLNVPRNHQEHRLSCEAATLRMAHNYFAPGSIHHDTEVLAVTGVDRRARNGDRWGNPNRAFVGDPDGQMTQSGYGVHSGPIASAATTFSPCRPAIALTNPSRATIAGYVASGFPVIVWGAHPGATGVYKRTWTAWDGERITAWSVEHVWVVVGFHGSSSKPSSFVITDPADAARRTVSPKAFDEFTTYFRTAVVVRG